MKEWDECLAMLGDGEVDEEGNVQMTDDQDTEFLDRDVEEREINVSLKVLPVCESFSCSQNAINCASCLSSCFFLGDSFGFFLVMVS